MLEHINPNDGEAAIVNAVDALREQQHRLGFENNWSLAELSPTPADYEWLLRWGKALSPQVARKWCQGASAYKPVSPETVSKQAAFGLLFTLFCSEVVRREAPMGAAWNHILHDKDREPRFPLATTQLLFTQGTASARTKEAIEEAARVFGLRNVFGIDGAHEWFCTIYLQLGFTYKGITGNLKDWIGGAYPPQSVVRLGEGSMHSLSFIELWNSLCSYRRKNISEITIRERLRGNPWVLPEWHYVLLQETLKAKLLPGPNERGMFLEPELPVLISTPILRWTGGTDAPAFVVHVQNLTSYKDWKETSYFVYGGKDILATLVKQSDGTYASIPANDIVLPFIKPTVSIRVVAPDGTVVATQILTLFSTDDEVNVYRARTGERINDPYQAPLNAGTEYLLLLPDDLTVSKGSEPWTTLPGRTERLYRLPAGTLSDFNVSLEGENFWTPRLFGAGPGGSDWAKEVSANWLGKISISENRPMSYFYIGNLLNGIRVTRVRIGGEILIGNNGELAGQPIYGPIPVFTESPKRKVQVTLERDTPTGIQSTRVWCELSSEHACWRGLVRHSETGWLRFDPQASVSVAELQSTIARLWTWDKTYLVESNFWFGSAHAQRNRPIIGAPGWGGPLTTRRSVFNADNETVLAASVFDAGIVATCLHATENINGVRDVRINFHSAVTLSRYHQVLWWDATGATFWADNVTAVDTGAWHCSFDGETTEPVAIGVYYEGQCKGAWWTNDWAARIVEIPSAIQSAALARSLKLPICAPANMTHMRKLLRNKPSETLSAWIGDVMPIPQLTQSDDITWKPIALRLLLRDYVPDGETAELLMRILGGNTIALSEQLGAMLRSLVSVCPYFAARTMIAYWDHRLPKQDQDDEIVRLRRPFRRACYRMVGLSIDAADNDKDLTKWRGCLHELYGKAAVAMSVDGNTIEPNFLDNAQTGLIAQAVNLFNGKSIPDIHRRNVETAFAIAPPVRELVAAKLLQDRFLHRLI